MDAATANRPFLVHSKPGAIIMTDEDDIERIPINQLHQEDGAREMATSPDMEPYLRLMMAEMRNADPTPEVEALCQLPLEKRYIWRVASALKWAFADLETESAEADKATLTPEDFSRVMELLKLRPMQFCLFLNALVGPEEMQRMMIEAIKVARQV
jgi:hypothetical protein